MLSVILGLVAALGWGSHDLIVRKIAPGANVLPQLASVMTVAALVVAPFGLIFGNAPVTLPVLAWAMGGGAAYCLASLALYNAFARAPARLVAPIIGSYPLLSLGFDLLRGAEVAPLAWAAAAVIVTGVGIVASMGEPGGEARHPAALPLALLACLGMATSFALGQEATRASDAATGAALTRAACAATALILLALRPKGLRAALAKAPILTAMGMADGLALTSVLAAGALADAVYASVASSLFGVVTILLAWVFLGEKVRLSQAAGIALIFGGLAMLGFT